MARREVKPGDIHESTTGLFFTEEYWEGRRSRQRIINLNGFKDLVQYAQKTGHTLIVTYQKSLYSCDALVVRLMESAPTQPVLQPQ